MGIDPRAAAVTLAALFKQHVKEAQDKQSKFSKEAATTMKTLVEHGTVGAASQEKGLQKLAADPSVGLRMLVKLSERLVEANKRIAEQTKKLSAAPAPVTPPALTPAPVKSSMVSSLGTPDSLTAPTIKRASDQYFEEVFGGAR